MSARTVALLGLIVTAAVVSIFALARGGAPDSRQGAFGSAAERLGQLAVGDRIAIAVVALETDTDGDTIPDTSDPTPDHDVGVFNVSISGPAPINLSDTTGAYMWVTADITNLRSYDEVVTIGLDVFSVPEDCAVDIVLVVPGQDTFLLLSGDTQSIAYRVRFECHAPTPPGQYDLMVDICIDQVPQTGDGGETSEQKANNSVWLNVPILISDVILDPAPPPEEWTVPTPLAIRCVKGTPTLPPDVAIDIKPGSFPNSINLGSDGVVPVAILTTSTFDAANGDPGTLTFEGASPLRWALEDVDGDGDTDMILHFAKADLTIAPDQTVACLQGSTFSGQFFEACDSIRIVPPLADIDGDSSGIGDPLVFGDGVEASLGSDPLDNCSDGIDDDAWPPDVDGDTVVTTLDAQPFNEAFGARLGDPPYSSRLDLHFDGTIDALDILILGEFMDMSCPVSVIDSDGDGTLDTDDPDDDNDSFPDEIELYLGTDHLGACATGSAHDAWPVDFDNNRQVDLLDALAFKPSFNTQIGEAAFRTRADLNADLTVTLQDLIVFKGYYRMTCEVATVAALTGHGGAAGEVGRA